MADGKQVLTLVIADQGHSMSPASSGECMSLTSIEAIDRLPCGLQKWSMVGIVGVNSVLKICSIHTHVRAVWEHESKHAQSD